MPRRALIDSVGDDIVAALEENGKLLEYNVEKKTENIVVGSIYKGRVSKVLSGMQAAFIDVGLGKNGYLFIGDMLFDKADLGGNVKLPDVLDIKEGDEILVQAVKDATSTKGVRLSSQLSFVGRLLVYMPNIDYVGVSRKITDETKREKLTKYAEGIKRSQGGFIVRTSAENASRSQIKKEAEVLMDNYKSVLDAVDDTPAGSVIYEEGNLASRVLREYDSETIMEYVVGDNELYKYVLAESKKRSREIKNKIKLYGQKTDMFKYYNLTGEIEKLLRNRVDLESGAYLVIDKTEALTAIDVNTGKFTGGDNLEDTVYKTNILAATEIARQVRLRNISGIVIVDFIDMQEEQHRNSVVEVLTEALKDDRNKCNVIGMTGLGLVEFTRKKKRRESSSMLSQPCPYCKGEGNIYSNDFIIMKIRTALLDLFADGYQTAIVDLNVNIANAIHDSGALKKDVEKIWSDRRVYIIPHKTYHHEFFIVKGDNSGVIELPETAQLLY